MAVDLYRGTCPITDCTYESGVDLKADGAIADLSIHFASVHAPLAIRTASISPSFLKRLFGRGRSGRAEEES